MSAGPAAGAARPGRPGPVILVGLPGAGKSTVGVELARRLGWRFVDLDADIERRAGRSIPEIFAAGGEATFRALERDATRALAGGGDLVLAPGGGWITDPATVALLRPPAPLIHLRVSPEVALERIRRSGVLRPLLAQGDPAARLAALADERWALYESADLAVDAELPLGQVVSLCERWLATPERRP